MVREGVRHDAQAGFAVAEKAKRAIIVRCSGAACSCAVALKYDGTRRKYRGGCERVWSLACG